MPEEEIWNDLRNLIQMGVSHVRKQKILRANHTDALLDSVKVNYKMDPNEALKILNESTPSPPSIIPPLYHNEFPIPEKGEFPQPPYMILLFSFLDSLCSDHDEDIQNYLSTQSDNFQNVDILRESAVYLGMVDDFCNEDTVDIIRTLIIFLQNVSIGSRTNQVCTLFL
jgi:hypothetical protein